LEKLLKLFQPWVRTAIGLYRRIISWHTRCLHNSALHKTTKPYSKGTFSNPLEVLCFQIVTIPTAVCNIGGLIFCGEHFINHRLAAKGLVWSSGIISRSVNGGALLQTMNLTSRFPGNFESLVVPVGTVWPTSPC